MGTHLVLDAEPAGCHTGEVTLVGRLPRSCGRGELVLADREFLGVPLWRAFTDSGADLLRRVPANRILPVERQLRDGSWISRMHAHTDPAHRDPVMVRVVAYQLHGTAHEGEMGGPPRHAPPGRPRPRVGLRGLAAYTGRVPEPSMITVWIPVSPSVGTS
ncbi:MULTISPECIES: hypothetical protein [unclassified Streptomyces]|uniref:hypothetical protein n=1 Tax=unclassified Streptomyces TaxID=2593676 RepID=UPI00247490F1|nr:MULTISPECIES: hypothetical protein [unclassified Streptomyces]